MNKMTLEEATMLIKELDLKKEDVLFELGEIIYDLKMKESDELVDEGTMETQLNYVIQHLDKEKLKDKLTAVALWAQDITDFDKELNEEIDPTIVYFAQSKED